MKNFFGIEDEVFFDKNIIKVLDGIAGSAKSSNVDKILKSAGVEYGRYTSTNKLKRDAIKRFGGNCDTIAGGLFYNSEHDFYIGEKEAEFDTVVIDEVLQADPKIFSWVINNCGKVNIIMCTDSHQMLTPHAGADMEELYNEFCKRPEVMRVMLTKTYRARTEETERAYNEAFRASSDGCDLFGKYKKNTPTIDFSELDYNYNSIYITHTNELEKLLYDTFDLYHKYDDELIPKGNIAKKSPKDILRYPIVPQCKAKDVRAYFQPSRVGTPTRYQGSEVTEEQTLYYLVERKSRVENREFYTVLTRLYNINNLVIVLCDPYEVKPLTEFNGKPVKSVISATVEKSEYLDAVLSGYEIQGKEYVLTGEDFSKFMEKVPKKGCTYHYSDKYVWYNDTKITYEEDTNYQKSTKSTMGSLLRKEQDFNYDFMPDFLRTFEDVQKSRYEGAKVIYDHLQAPYPKNADKDRKDYKYGLDLKSAYPHILAFAKLPTGREFIPRFADDPYKTCVEESEEYTDFYLSWGCEYLGCDSIVTGEYVRHIQEVSKTPQCFYYIGSTTAKRGSKMGAELHEKSHKSIEAKKSVKDVHYGYSEKRYLEPVEFEDGEPEAYIVHKKNNHQLLMMSIKSQLSYIMVQIMEQIYGELNRGYVHVDCIYFDTEEDIAELGERIHKVLPNYDFRIFKNDESDAVLYRTYEDLKTKKELEAERSRRRRAEKKARG